MKYANIDSEWTFRRGMIDSLGGLDEVPGTVVNLPHDGMIGTKVTPDAPGKYDTGYFVGDLTNYTKYVFIPKEWDGECIGLSIDGAMMNATIDVNGSKVGAHHYGYAPFYTDLSDYVTFGEENRITINVNTSTWTNSRWYTGSGLYRGVKLCHGPKMHIANDGVYLYTKEIADNRAYIEALVEIENADIKNSLARVTIQMFEEESDAAGCGACDGNDAAGCVKDGDVKVGCCHEIKRTESVIMVNARSKGTARMAFSISDPKLWDAENPNLYNVKVTVTNIGGYRTHLIESDNQTTDEASTLFGIRTITADAERGLQINGHTVKLRGGCVHHDNGLLGSVSLYETEARKVKKLKEVGFNAIRTAHNPPSKALIEACDRLGMYVFDEAFDAWGMAKRSGDFSLFFDSDWEKDITAFVKRDRTHPCVIMWSTGNEIPERGGLGNGYTEATMIAEKVRSLDGSRPISNGVCSMWSGLDDQLSKDKRQTQNAAEDPKSCMWETVTEPFTNGLDIVGYNYYEDGYEKDHEMFPDRVILGSENFPREIGYRWPLVEKLPYVIGEFTWTAWDYLGEAGIGKALYLDKDDPLVNEGDWVIMPPSTSPFPWRCANDADVDITGVVRPQGQYRGVVWGKNDSFVYSKHPDTFGKVEKTSMWGFPYVMKDWNYEGYEGRPVELVVFTNAEEAEVFVNGKSIGRKKVSFERPWPNTAVFETIYEPGEVVAVSYKDNKEISRDVLKTTKAPSSIVLTPSKKTMRADGHDLVYVDIEVRDEDGLVVPNAQLDINAQLKAKTQSSLEAHADINVTNDLPAKTDAASSANSVAFLAGFGSGNPITDEDYTDDAATTYRGRALAILRSGYEAGELVFSVSSDSGELSAQIKLNVN